MVSLRIPDWNLDCCTSKRVCTLLEVHPPVELVKEMEGEEFAVPANPSIHKCCKGNWSTSKAVVTSEKVRASKHLV